MIGGLWREEGAVSWLIVDGWKKIMVVDGDLSRSTPWLEDHSFGPHFLWPSFGPQIYYMIDFLIGTFFSFVFNFIGID
jgi:hypothetical protein